MLKPYTFCDVLLAYKQTFPLLNHLLQIWRIAWYIKPFNIDCIRKSLWLRDFIMYEKKNVLVHIETLSLGNWTISVCYSANHIDMID